MKAEGWQQGRRGKALFCYNPPYFLRKIRMVRVEFLGPIEKEPVELRAASLAEVAEQLGKDEELKSWLESCAVAVNDTLVSSLETPLKSGDKVSLLPPVCGG
jgi:molybdopterin synthase sulfur carrier subunit